jgi:hypothetical protein
MLKTLIYKSKIHLKRCLKFEPNAAKNPAKAANIMIYKNL